MRIYIAIVVKSVAVLNISILMCFRQICLYGSAPPGRHWRRKSRGIANAIMLHNKLWMVRAFIPHSM